MPLADFVVTPRSPGNERHGAAHMATWETAGWVRRQKAEHGDLTATAFTVYPVRTAGQARGNCRGLASLHVSLADCGPGGWCPLARCLARGAVEQGIWAGPRTWGGVDAGWSVCIHKVCSQAHCLLCAGIS